MEPLQLKFKLSNVADADIRLYGLVTQEAMQKLIDMCELMKDTFPLQVEMEVIPPMMIEPIVAQDLITTEAH